MKPTKQTEPTTEDALIAGAKDHFEQAQAALRKGCGHALIAGLHLIPLHASESIGRGGDRRSIKLTRDSLIKGFKGAVEEIGLTERTAYRWMNAAFAGCVRARLLPDDADMEEMVAKIPPFRTPIWRGWEKALLEVAEGMSLNRLMLGTYKASTEEHRYDELLRADEEGRERATLLLQGIADGKYTLVQAVRALGSLEAYDTLRSGGGEKVRKDPVYLSMDGATGHLDGLFVKSLTTLRNTFVHWEETPAPARKKARELWLDVIDAMPADLKNG